MTIWCIGRNYAAHARELGNEVPKQPLVFLKPEAALRGLDPAPMAFPEETYSHECELVVRIGRHIALKGEGSWADVEAVTLGLDLTRREVQTALKAKGKPWTTAKGFAGAGVLGDFVPVGPLGDPHEWTFWLDVNGERRQTGRLTHMMRSVPQLLSQLAEISELRIGDLVFTGTPEGVGPLQVGDTFEMGLDGSESHRWSGQL